MVGSRVGTHVRGWLAPNAQELLHTEHTEYTEYTAY